MSFCVGWERVDAVGVEMTGGNIPMYNNDVVITPLVLHTQLWTFPS